MLVSHRYGFIYTKTQKTAGTSIEVYFERFCMHEGEWSPGHDREEYVSSAGIIGYRGPFNREDCTWRNHMSAASIRVRLGEAIWNDYLKFCAIRNPFERLISMFYFLRRRCAIKVDPNASDREQFESWIARGVLPDDRDVYLIKGEFCLDDIVRYETLSEDMARLCRRLGVPWEPEALLRLKSGVRPPEATAGALYTPKAREIAEKIYRFELDLFGYSFPGEESPEPAAHV